MQNEQTTPPQPRQHTISSNSRAAPLKKPGNFHKRIKRLKKLNFAFTSEEQKKAKITANITIKLKEKN
jgi:hypothetical protein